jgi:hypothetical protein
MGVALTKALLFPQPFLFLPFGSGTGFYSSRTGILLCLNPKNQAAALMPSSACPILPPTAQGWIMHRAGFISALTQRGKTNSNICLEIFFCVNYKEKISKQMQTIFQLR